MSASQQVSSSNTTSQSAETSQSGSAGSQPLSEQSVASSTSYATATKATSGAAPHSTASVALPSAPGQQHGRGQSVTNGKLPSTMAAPTIVNSNSANGAPPALGSDHSRRSSVTISAAGATGSLPNGVSTAPPTQRPNIMFGAVDASQSPSVAHSVPYANQTNLLHTPQAGNPRVTSPAGSPSPIPQPAPSGGRPPSGLQGQGNGLNFGSMPGDDANRQMRGVSQPQMMAAGPVHLRRESSQSSDMGNPGMQYGQVPQRGGYMGRGGRGGFNPQYQGQMPYSPGPGFRNMPSQGRPGQPYPPQFQNQMGPHSGSPQFPPRSPALSGAHPSTPQMPHQVPGSNQMPYQPPAYGQFAQHLTPQAGQYGMQPPFDPNYGYYNVPYPTPPQYLSQQPGSPGMRGMPSTPHQQYGRPQPPSQTMSRTSSQVSERPASSLGGHPQPGSSITPANPRSHTPSQSTGTPGPTGASNFKIPERGNKGIVIKNADGEILTFDNKKPSPAPPVVASTPSPAPTSSAPTPPEPAPTASTHVRTESKTGKSVAEIQAEFKEQVKRGQGGGDKIKEEVDVAAKVKEEAEETAVVEEAKAEEHAAQEQAAEAKAAPLEEDVDAAVEAVNKEALVDKPEDSPAEETVQESEREIDSQPAAEPETAPSEAEKSTNDEDEAERLRQEEEERLIAELEAAEREEEEREAAFQEKKKKEAEEKAARAKEEAAKADEEMRRLEREAEEAEEAREKERAANEETDEGKAERENAFASLKRSNLGPGGESQSGTATPASDDSSAPAPVISQTPKAAAPTSKPKPSMLKLDTTKPVEPAQPTAGMQSLKSARLLQLQNEAVNYPAGIKSPNPALNQGTRRDGRLYDKSFLMQFQDVYKEKPSVDWEQKLKDTVGDASDSAAPKSARTPSGMGNRQTSARGPQQAPYQPMGTLGQGRTLPPGTTSQARFEASNRPLGPNMSNPIAPHLGRGSGQFPMGSIGMSRTGSMQNIPPHVQSPRIGGTSQRGSRNASRRGDEQRVPSKREIEAQNKSMPLTAGAELKTLETSATGWKPMSAGRANVPVTDPTGHMPPDIVQRKVKSNLNKMTPERFDKIADQILEIASQSKDENDGRTLRQVIALTFEKACDEAHWAAMYARFCFRMLERMSPDIQDENVKDKAGQPIVGGVLFRKYLLNRCQEEFERGWDINLPDKAEGQTDEAAMLSDEYYIAAAAKRKGLGLVQFIGELYKLKMLSVKIMHQCFTRLLDFEGMPDESAVESLVKLLRTVGSVMEIEQAGPGLLNTYFERIDKIMNMPGIPSRMYFMLLDTVDLRKAKWVSKDDAKGPKTIQEIREEAAVQQQQAEAERMRQSQRGGGGRMPSGRGDARNMGQMAPPDYPKNHVETNDLRKLGARASNKGSTGATRSLGPTSMFQSRSSSGRQGLGPSTGLFNRGDESSSSSRAPSQRERKEEEPKSATNSFGALATLDASGGADVTPASSPPTTKAQPVTDSAADSGKTESSDATAVGSSDKAEAD